ncbi:fused MFS/spermidine synthase [Prosthecobacter vanneervenii]|uniref:Spermidine synthase/MFS family permease n=1 Tax=Prosthecobacter vanneervenii TaxID=48466 RepID=A0A7W7Y6U0_9BACT|nr:fused MFS/spermidine synthase [Prosthecobacter vanneervenii]MBB5030580.1 spermidine synthase/MFS family permease [Prosthecobacter vanneervenii]
MKSPAALVSTHSSVRLTQFMLACILMLSGFCSLVYQTVWLREFRLVFGGAAPAAAAVMAVFMGGLGFGGKFFGSWVERVGRPFRFYARLEVGIALAAAASPALLGLARSLYLKTGGTAGMGLGPATCLQLLITALVLGAPCFLMGGTLPAAMKFAQHDDDPRRSTTAFFYGINIAGAVCGALLSTFWLLPNQGNHSTLTIAVLANLGIALAAWGISAVQEKEPRLQAEASGAGQASVAAQAPAPFVLAAAFMSGFTFFVAELVWYRVSTPLLGGSVYGFGLVLCVVLAGMGTGGLLYALMLKKAEPGIAGFTLVSALQALAILLPYALGDRIAHLALILNDSLRGLGLGHMALGWAVVMSLLAFLPSLLSGIQFPLLVSLLGRGNAGVGRQLGRAYLWNTFGSITGSLLGGFILVPWLQLTGCWLLAALLVAAMSAASLVLQLRRNSSAETSSAPAPRLSWSGGVAFVLLAVSGFCALGTTGPTAMWMQSPIGYGRVTHGEFNTALSLENLQRSTRRTLVQAYDGRETSVAVVGGLQYSFLTNGKSDGSAVMDASTQVMLGLTGAILHPHPQQACVVGLGTGTTAGWLADVPGMQRVDVLELEEEIRKVARYFDPVSRNATQHPRIRNITGDAREFLLTRGQDYDLIVSEPSNPCRAGVANLYTREFYRNASQRLGPGGIFCQWVQGYEVEPEAITTVISTLRQVFAKVEVWSTQGSDMLLVCSNDEAPWQIESVRQRIKQEPMAEALRRLWKTDTAEGFFASCIASSSFCTALAATGTTINTDDMNRLEFSFARTVARGDNCALQLARAATRAGGSLPRVQGALDLPLYYSERLHLPGRLWESATADLLPAEAPADVRDRVPSLKSYWRRDYAAYLAAPMPAATVLSDRVLQAYARARTGAPDAQEAIAVATPLSVVDACLLRALASHHQRQPQPILDHLTEGLDALMTSPWCDLPLLNEALGLLGPLSQFPPAVKDPRFRALFDKLDRTYPAGVARDTMLSTRCEMAMRLPLQQQLAAVHSYGQPFPWQGRALALRVSAYMQAQDPRLDEAVADLNRYLAQGGRVGGESPPFTVQLQQTAPDTMPQAEGITVGAKAGK